MPKISAVDLLQAYRQGLFPMAFPDAGNEIFWLSPDPRAVIPLDAFHVPRSVARLIRRGRFVTTVDRCFGDVITNCAARKDTWISKEIIKANIELHARGYARSVEVWSGDRLVGGLYGVALGGAFFAESMYYEESGASKVALVDLAHRLAKGGYVLLDTQYLTGHLERFGAVEIDRRLYLEQLATAVKMEARWLTMDGPLTNAIAGG